MKLLLQIAWEISSLVTEQGAMSELVISAVFTAGRSLPVFPEQRTSSDRPGIAQTYHFRTHALRQKHPSRSR